MIRRRVIIGEDDDVKKWRLIRSIVVPDNVADDTSGVEWITDDNNQVTGVYINTDEDGQAFELEQIDMRICNANAIIADTSGALYSLYLKINATNAQNKNVFDWYRYLSSDVKTMWIRTGEHTLNDTLSAFGSAYRNTVRSSYEVRNAYCDAQAWLLAPNTEMYPIKSIYPYVVTALNPGTTIEIYGR